VIFAGDVQTLRAKIVTELAALDAAVAACGAKLDATTKASWTSQRLIFTNWIASVDAETASVFPSGQWGNLYSQGLGLESVIRLDWWPRLAAAGCSMPAAPSAPAEPKLSTSNPSSPLAWIAELGPAVTAVAAFLILRELRSR
jgi:hypothetical protein